MFRSINPSVVIGCLMAASFASGATYLLTQPEPPLTRAIDITEFRLMGFDCEKKGVTMVAIEEDQFPRCREIVRLGENVPVEQSELAQR